MSSPCCFFKGYSKETKEEMHGMSDQDEEAILDRGFDLERGWPARKVENSQNGLPDLCGYRFPSKDDA